MAFLFYLSEIGINLRLNTRIPNNDTNKIVFHLIRLCVKRCVSDCVKRIVPLKPIALKILKVAD